MDILDEINRTHRELTVAADDTKTIALRRHYDADVADVWSACTDPERIGRWFLPVSGDLRLGGKYQLEGNAGGEILACEPPRLLKITWIYGEPTGVSEVEVRLSPDADGTLFELVHTAAVPEEMWRRYGPGAVGVGWDLGLLGLAPYLAEGAIPDGWQESLDATVMTASSRAWGAALRASGASEQETAEAVANTTAFYTGAEA
ncbi:SRPBCC family protein [Nonomuraea sp. NN258]|uniref:SRPBCC family protein n=1 Tax=Nonomuraea antri TaxID=2730852 RepID=UPI00156868C0|nr:SRPBCC family protein [Nonomuraea antri]NRQ35488.1 SRPBCC family protein [Nonomuraea antri]